MPTPQTLMTVHAHPDDETISTGGVMARYSRAGHRVVCVTCTGGEHGEIVVPEMDTPENHARLAEIRAEELRRALDRLGPVESHTLGYVDSGMMGTPENTVAGSFWQADMDEAVGKLVRLVRQHQPSVMVSYNDFGGYGHPDHIRTAQIAKLAFERAGDPNSFPEQLLDEPLAPWAPAKFYETVFDLARRDEVMKRMQERGVQNRWMGDAAETDEQRAEREALFKRMAAASGPVTTRVDVDAVLDDKLAALREHVTQIAADSWFLALPAEDWHEFQPTEDFTLRVSRVGVRIPEEDLFAGIP